MENTSLSEQEQQAAEAIYRLCKAFIDNHSTRELHQHLTYLFAYHAATPMYTELIEGNRENMSLPFVDVSLLLDNIARHLPDQEAQEYIKMGRSQIAA